MIIKIKLNSHLNNNGEKSFWLHYLNLLFCLFRTPFNMCPLLSFVSFYSWFVKIIHICIIITIFYNTKSCFKFIWALQHLHSPQNMSSFWKTINKQYFFIQIEKIISLLIMDISPTFWLTYPHWYFRRSCC